MMLLHLKPFEIEDALDIAREAVEPNLDGHIEQGAAFNKAHGPAMTAYLPNGQRLAAAGVLLHRNGSGTVWFIGKKAIRQHKLSVLTTLKKMIEIWSLEMGITRLRTHSEIGFPESQRLLEHLGFKRLRTIMKNTHYFYRMETR